MIDADRAIVDSVMMELSGFGGRKPIVVSEEATTGIMVAWDSVVTMRGVPLILVMNFIGTTSSSCCG